MSSWWQMILGGGCADDHTGRSRRGVPAVLMIVGLPAWLSGCVAESEQLPPSEELVQSAAGLGDICCNVPSANPTVNGFRLSLEYQLAVTAADVTKNTAFLVPYESNSIALYDGVAWVVRQATYTTPAVASAGTTINASYDVYAYWNGDDIVLEREATGSSTLALRDGVHVKGNDPRRRYVGVVGTNSLGQFEDSAKNRLVWNRNNQVRRSITGVDPTTWTLTGNNAWREVGSSTANRVTVVSGVLSGVVSGTYVSAEAVGMCIPTAAGSNGYMVATGIGIDVSSASSAPTVELASGTFGSLYAHSYSAYEGYLAPGVHTVRWLEIGQTGGTFTCIGTSSAPFGKLGLNGWALM